MERPLPNNRHVEVVHDRHLQPLAPLVVVAVVEALDVVQDREAVVLAGLGPFGHGVEPEGPVRVWSVRNGGEVELRRVPAADPVVSAEVAGVVAEAVGGGAVPLGVDEHVVTVLVGQPGDAAFHGQLTFLQKGFQDLEEKKKRCT